MRNLKPKTLEKKIRNTKARIKNQDTTAGVKASTSIEAVAEVEAEAQKEEEKRAQARLKKGTIKTGTTGTEETGIGRRIQREIKKETGDIVVERGIVSESVIVSVIGKEKGKGKRKENVIARRTGNVIARKKEYVKKIEREKGIVKGIKEDQSIKAIAKEAKGTNEIEAIDFLI